MSGGVIDLITSSFSSSEEEVDEDKTVREPAFEVFEVITSEEINFIVKAIGEEVTQAALKRFTARTPERAEKVHSKTRTPRPLKKKVCAVRV